MLCCCCCRPKSKKIKMPNTITKTLHLCFSKLKPPTTTTSQTTFSSPSLKSNGCQSISTTLIKNFNSLYDDVSGDVILPESDAQTPSPTPDLTSVYASQRFFFSSPGRSNSIFDSSPEYLTPSPALVSSGGIAVPTYSPDPYVDFRRSMEEMVEARGLNVGDDWDGLHELLLCYLALNRKRTHKFIIGAFLDLLVSLVTGDSPEPEVSGECGPQMVNAG